MSTETLADREHLLGFDCPRCGHPAIAHHRNPGCRNCLCNSDPLCWRGLLTSKHDDAESGETHE